MLAFATPGRHISLVHVARRGSLPSSAVFLLSTHRNSRARGKLRRLFHQQLRPQLCFSPWKVSRKRHHHHQQEQSSWLSTGLKSPISTRDAPARRSGFLSPLKSKGVDTSNGHPAPTPSPPEDSSAFEIAAGMRVRLRDTGRLGTVVGKKAGGWWIVDVLESWGGAGTKKAPNRSSKVRRDGDGRASRAATKRGAGRGASRQASTIASGEPISTRMGNMEPLGAAYAPSENALETINGAATSGKQRRASSSSGSKSETAQREVEEEAYGKGARSEVGIDVGSTGRASVKKGEVEKAVASVPSELLGQMMPVDVSAGYAAAEGEKVAIHAIRGDGLPHAQMKEWLVFSDLHVRSNSLPVSLEVLDRVNEEAMKRQACGIAFLGDFWHSRGSLKVDLLVPVMKHLATWTRPVVMIPGNHDQVTLGGGMHALTPLQFAFADSKQALVLSEPTLFLNALWIPHRRNNSVVEALLASEEAHGARAIFCHVDIKGAAMNDGLASHAGVPRSVFPDDVPTFSGHFHKPHTVGDGFIRYIGSPYQTCLSESGQSKALLVLDASTWKEKESIPLDIGMRFFRVKGDDQPLPDAAETSPGDRVVWTVKDAGSEEVRRRADALRQAMVEVEIREAPRPFPVPTTAGMLPGIGGGQDANANRTVQVNGAGADSSSLSPEALFRAYLKREREGGRNISREVEQLGFNLIEESGQRTPSKGKVRESVRENRSTSLVLHSIRLKNFGPFRDEVTYPLDDRGVVLLRGSNLDDSGADSNGAGKTTLAMSALWALAGVFDARPVSDGRVVDVVHEFSRAPSSMSSASSDAAGKRVGVRRASSRSSSNSSNYSGGKGAVVAEATLTGSLNGKPLWLQRRKGARVNQLFLEHDGNDLTRQVAKETQVVLEEELGLSPHVLVRGIFQGQHHVNGLLESTDAQLKEELALLVPMDSWRDLASQSRARARKSDEDAARFRERAVTRREDLVRLTQELERARAEEVAASNTNNNGKSDASNRNVTAAVAPVKSPSPVDAATVTAKKAEGLTRSAARSSEADLAARDPDAKVDPKAVDSGDGGQGGMTASLDAAVSEAGRASKLARRDVKRAREDAESAEEALRSLRRELDGLVEGWADRRMRILGEAKAAQERVSFARRDADQAENSLRDAEREAMEADREYALLRERNPDLWGDLVEENPAGIADDEGGELKSAETIMATTRAALAGAEAALRHADESVQAHAGMELHGEGTCHACGQPMTGSLIYERGEILQVSRNAAATEVERLKSEDAVNEMMLARIRAKDELRGQMVRTSMEAAKARERIGGSEAELKARREDLGHVEKEAAAADGEMEGQARKEAASRREWSAKMKAAEWALKAHRDKQIFAQHELEEALAREAGLQLESQAEQAEQQRALQTQESAQARVREIEAAVDRVRRELEEVEDKERKASALKANSIALAEHMGVRGVQNFVFRDAVSQLQANVARYLHALSDGALLLHLSIEGDRVVKRASVRAADESFRDRALSQLSGGQWRRASLALELAFAELTRQRSRFSCNLLVLDEVLSQLDSCGRARVANMLRALAHGRVADDESGVGAMYSTILVILQDLPAEELQETFDQVDYIVKHRDSSSVVVDGCA